MSIMSNVDNLGKWAKKGATPWNKGRTTQAKFCTVYDCNNPTDNKNLCKKHYTRFRRNGFTHIKPNANILKSGIPYLNLRGYMEFFSKEHGRKIRVHRYVMEKYIGRKLDPKEAVHHINGNKLDNRIENLELLANNAIHVSKHGKEIWRKRHQAPEYLDKINKIKIVIARYKDITPHSQIKHVGIICFCGKQAHVFGLCKTHYGFAHRHGYNH